MDKDALHRRLLATFLEEIAQQVEVINRDLLAIERGPEPARRAELVAELFRAAHTLKGAARAAEVPEVHAACHRAEDLLGGVREGSIELDAARLELLFELADAVSEAADRLRTGRPLVGSRVVELTPRLEAAARGGALPPAPKRLEPEEEPATPAVVDTRARVSLARLDELLTASQELMLARRRVEDRAAPLADVAEALRRVRDDWRRAGVASKLGRGATSAAHRRAIAHVRSLDERLRAVERELDRLTASMGTELRALDTAATRLEEGVRKVRMVPFAEACDGLDRVVRDLVASTGKRALLVVVGGDVEIGRVMLDEVRGALVHLVRNAIDHGLEPPAARERAGKDPVGRIVVQASLRGPVVEVSVEDDGAGLDLDALRASAARRGVPAPTDDEGARWLVFESGLTTSPTITEVSGRGVGLDVVRRRIEEVHGTVRVDSTRGRGARFTLSVPLSIISTRVLTFRVAGQVFAFPTASVARLARPSTTDVRTVAGRPVVAAGGPPVPLVSMAAVLGWPALGVPEGTRFPVVVLAFGDRRVALAVDELLAERDVVVKTLGRRLRTPLVSGATLLGTGEIALLLSVAEIGSIALAATPSAPVVAPRAPQSARRRVLVVDDSITTRTLVETVLESAGYDVLTAPDGAEAWRVLQEKGADAVVADVEMPRLDGIGLTETIRSSRRFAGLPVVLVTALESDVDKRRGLDAGASAYLVKRTFDQATLLETLKGLL